MPCNMLSAAKEMVADHHYCISSPIIRRNTTGKFFSRTPTASESVATSANKPVQFEQAWMALARSDHDTTDMAADVPAGWAAKSRRHESLPVTTASFEYTPRAENLAVDKVVDYKGDLVHVEAEELGLRQRHEEWLKDWATVSQEDDDNSQKQRERLWEEWRALESDRDAYYGRR